LYKHLKKNLFLFQVLWQNQQYQQELMRRHMTSGGSQPANNSTVPPPMPAHMVQPFPFGPGPDLVYRPSAGYHYVQTGVPGPLQLDPVAQVIIFTQRKIGLLLYFHVLTKVFFYLSPNQ
jgi:hypothetical protein